MCKVGKLTLVATPIGNLGDMSPRAASALRDADIIACEDTRVTRKLLALTGTRTDARLRSYHDHNAGRTRRWLLDQLRDGRKVALVSDAGTPLISDPGYKLVVGCREEGIAVDGVPGPCAALAALAVSGLPSDRFMFCGFIAGTANARKRQFGEVAFLEATTIWFESPRRLAASLADMAGALGTRRAVVARELTKMHEETVTGTLHELADVFAGRAAVKGEIVVVVEGNDGHATQVEESELEKMLIQRMEKESLSDAVKSVAAHTGLPRNSIYSKALELSGGGKG